MKRTYRRMLALSLAVMVLAAMLCSCTPKEKQTTGSDESTTTLADPIIAYEDYTIAYDDPATVQGVTQENCDNYSVFVFDGFVGEATLKMERKDMEKGKIYYYAELTDGFMYVMYRQSPHDSVQMMATLAGGVKMPDNNNGGLVDSDEIAIIFDAESAVSGRLVVSFVPLGETT